MNAVNAIIKTMKNCYSPKELQYITDALDQYNRIIVSKQQMHTVDRLRQIFSLAAQGKEVH